MADRITLTGLTVRGFHGVFDYEKRDGQDFVIDAVAWLDLSEAARTDDLTATLDYGALAELARAVVAGPPRDLIETVATEIAETALARWPVFAIEITVHKPHAPIPLQFADVAVTVRRSRNVGRAAGQRSGDAGPGAAGSGLSGPGAAGRDSAEPGSAGWDREAPGSVAP